MITPTAMYWLTRLDGIHMLMITVMLLSIVAVFVMIMGVCLDALDPEDTTCKVMSITAPICFSVSVLASVLIPTTKEMAAILIVPKVANSEKVQEIGGRLYDLSVEWMEELRPAKKEGDAE